METDISRLEHDGSETDALLLYKKASRKFWMISGFVFLLPGLFGFGILYIFGGQSTLWVIDGLLLGVGLAGFTGSGMIYIHSTWKIRRLEKDRVKNMKPPPFKVLHEQQKRKMKLYGKCKGEGDFSEVDKESQVSTTLDPLLLNYVFDERDGKIESFILKDAGIESH